MNRTPDLSLPRLPLCPPLADGTNHIEDWHRWLNSEHGRVACVEWRWLATLRETAVFQYELADRIVRAA
jgi:hypothetical protein